MIKWDDLSNQKTYITTLLLKIKSASDYKQTFSFTNPWTDTEKIDTIIHSSVLLWLSLTQTFAYYDEWTDDERPSIISYDNDTIHIKQTFVWAGSAWAYVPLSITYS